MSARQAAGMHATYVNMIAIVLISAIVLVVFVVTHVLGASDDARSAVVRDSDGVEHVLPLSQESIQTITTSEGTNVVEVRDGRVRVAEAYCPNQDCVRQGWIDTPGEQIVCLPHKLVVEVSSQDSSSSYDVVGR